jgi:hypothetical protein
VGVGRRAPRLRIPVLAYQGAQLLAFVLPLLALLVEQLGDRAPA